MAKWYAGIDAGGTKTQVRLVRVEGDSAAFIGEGIAGPGNFHDVKAAGVVAVTQRGLARAASAGGLAQVPPLAGMVIGAAGVGRPDDADELHGAFCDAFPRASVDVHNDAIVALAGGSMGDPGVVVIAGTGSTAWSYAADGSWRRVGGWGYIIGDEGSGYWIGLRALSQLARSEDGREPATGLTSVIFDHLRIREASDIIPLLHGDSVPKQLVARLAPLVLAEAEKGDAVAIGIVDEALHHLIQLVAAAYRDDLPKPSPLVLVGGLFKNDAFHQRFVRSVVQRLPALEPVWPRLDPAAGACVLALRGQGGLSESIRSSLLASYA